MESNRLPLPTSQASSLDPTSRLALRAAFKSRCVFQIVSSKAAGQAQIGKRLSIIEFGMMMYGREIVTNAAREGARAGIVQGPPKRTSSEITTIANNYLTGTCIRQADVTFTPAGVGLSTPNMLTVTAQYSYNFLIPYIPAVLGIPNPLIITTQVVMRHE